MNDYRLDPPEEPIPPECCGEDMDVDTHGVCTCAKCGKRIMPGDGIDADAFDDVELPDDFSTL